MTAFVKHAAALLLVLATAAAASAATSGGGSSAVNVLQLEAKTLNAADWKDGYALMSPRFRQICSYSRFISLGEQARSYMAQPMRVKLLSARVSGSRAYLTYATTAPPIPRFVTKNDLFVKLGGRWYDEVDRVTTCS
jgi:hypothetical protein